MPCLWCLLACQPPCPPPSHAGEGTSPERAQSNDSPRTAEEHRFAKANACAAISDADKPTPGQVRIGIEAVIKNVDTGASERARDAADGGAKDQASEVSGGSASDQPVVGQRESKPS
jgi:hypothetical protein